jgi:hypothetical protein
MTVLQMVEPSFSDVGTSTQLGTTTASGPVPIIEVISSYRHLILLRSYMLLQVDAERRIALPGN